MDTEHQKKLNQLKKWNEKDHPRDSDGKFIEKGKLLTNFIYKVPDTLKVQRKTLSPSKTYVPATDKIIRDVFQTESDACFKNLDESQKVAVNGYTGAIFLQINNILKGGHSGKEKKYYVQKYIIPLDIIMRKTTVLHDVVSYKGTKAKHYRGWEVGDEKKLPIFLSTSLSKKKAEDYKSDFMLEILVPKGAKGLYIGKHSSAGDENELLLNRETKFKVLERTINTMKLEVLL
ncbi:MAG: ADP-ribosyltransferase [Treponema sp.]|nr:ADP-ribosyltransferase [Treponema sp.]